MLKFNGSDDYIAVACIILAAVFGLISNGLSLYLTRTRPRFFNAFGILCSGFLICNLQTIFVQMTWCSIVLSLKSSMLSSPKLFFVRLIGVVLDGGWFGSLFLHFLTAINRFCAFVFLTKYNQLWSPSRTFKIVIITYTLAMIYCTHHLHEDCSLFFNYNTYRWLIPNSFPGELCSTINGLLAFVMITGMTLIDFIALIKMIAYLRSMQRNRSAINEKEVMFFKQSCKLSLLYITHLIGFNVFPHFTEDKWTIFISSTLAWILTQSLDGLAFLIFNRKIICKTNSNLTRITPAGNLILF